MCVCVCLLNTATFRQEVCMHKKKGRIVWKEDCTSSKQNTAPFEGMPHVFIDAGPEDCFLIATLRIFKINCVMWWYNFSILLAPSKSIVKKPQLPALWSVSVSLLQSFTTTGCQAFVRIPHDGLPIRHFHFEVTLRSCDWALQRSQDTWNCMLHWKLGSHR
jgi:hypothetical protein